ncbi:radical SAM family heme chaperone HemW [Verrucomicrobium spinosum]|uniref:radical SAM family heme chaperone HemW n=1 Tax=Verrucomicrobium spinosum TaxID=2736 RepID=UPI00094628D3|nr:radical SAM family heme chaperone HemW [Verrucomicrobium spinosum]
MSSDLPYCSFYKHTLGGTDMGAFVKAVLRELELHQRTMPVTARTIYLGGGTPTALSEKHLADLLTGLKEAAAASGSVLDEFGLEANPKTVSASKARLLKELGVTRISLGVQAWDEPTLKLLGRDHAPDEAAETFQILREAGIPSLNVDLMFSIPGQTLKVWNAGLEKTLSLGSDHVSCYNLTYEEDTEFLSQLQAGVLDTDEDRDADHFQSTMDILEAAGFEHYEISNYARPGHRSVHNQAYWRGADYLGLGPSASSTVQRVRWKNISDTAGYIRLVQEGRLPITESEELSDRQWLIERVALELRTAEGMSRERVAPSQTEALTMLVTEGLVTATASRVILTRAGKALSDRIAEQLLPDE